MKEFFWSTKVFSNEIIQYSETKTATENRDTPPSFIQNFSGPEISETPKDSPTNIFGTVRQKKFRRKNVIPPSMHKIFRYPKFSETFRACPRNFSALWDIKISTGNRDMPPLIHKFFSIPENFRKTEGFLYKAFRFGPVRQKVPTKPWCPLLCMKIFDERIFLKHQSVLQWNNSIQWDKNCDGKSWYSPIFYPKFFGTRN